MFDNRDQTPHFISETQIREILYSRSQNLNQAQRDSLLREISRERSGGKLSLYKLHHLLNDLVANHQITLYEQEAAEGAFAEFFQKRYGR